MNVYPIRKSFWQKMKAFVANERKLARMYLEKIVGDSEVKYVRPKVFMIQTSNHFWRIENEKGHVMLSGILLHNKFEVEAYIKRYVNRTDWMYEIVSMKKDDKK